MNDASGKDSYRRILRSSSIIGMASVLNILFGILRMKAVALLLGPNGVGLVGIFQSLIQTGAAIAAFGTATSGTRQVSVAVGQNDLQRLADVRRALIWGSAGLSVIGGVIFVLFGQPIMTHLLGDEASNTDALWLAAGITLSVLSGAQIALLTGLQRIGDVALVQALSGLVGSTIGVAGLWLMGRDGLAQMVVMAPLSASIAGSWYVSRLEHRPSPLGAVLEQWRQMVGTGTAFMLSGLVAQLGYLAVRTLVQQGLGAEALGQFQAAWAIGAMYLSFVLGAMSTDFFSRLSAIIGNPAAATKLVNEQTEVALLLCGPVLLAMLACAPWAIRLLYSEEFAPAVDILRWQLLGDILKIMSWPLGYLLLAIGAGRAFIITETWGMVVFVIATASLLPVLDKTATGVAFLLLYVAYLPAVWFVARKRIDFRFSTAVIRNAIALIIAALVIVLLSRVSNMEAAAVGGIATFLFATYAFLRLGSKTESQGRIGTIISLMRRIRQKFNP